MQRKKYLFHVTSPENVENIIKTGLRRNVHRPTCAVYCSERPLSWYEDGLEILRLDITGLSNIHATTSLPEMDEIMFWGDIPPTKQTKDGEKPRFKVVTDKYVGRKEHFRDSTKMIEEEIK